MQCRRPIWRAICGANNAYSSSRALRATFGSTPERRLQVRPPVDHEETVGSESNDLVHRHIAITPRDPGEQEQKLAPNDDHFADGAVRDESHGEATTAAHTATSRTLGQALVRPRSDEKSRTSDDLRDNSLKQAPHGQSNYPVIADMSKHDFWLFQKYKKSFVDAESWKSKISTIVLRNRRMAKDRSIVIGMTPKEREALKIAFDYQPRPILPRQPPRDLKDSPVPWAVRSSTKESHMTNTVLGNLWLSEEIARFADFMKPTALEKAARKAAGQEVMDYIRKTVALENERRKTRELQDGAVEKEPHNIGMELHGSEKTGLALPMSDIDIRIWDQRALPGEQSRFFAHRYLSERIKKIAKAMDKQPDLFRDINYRTDTYPILNFQHIPSGVDFQIVATESASPQEAITRKYLAELSGLRELFIVVRTFLDMRNLLAVPNGGIGSYGCFIMLAVPFLREAERYLTRIARDSILGGQMRRFLCYYDPTSTVNPQKMGVSCHPRQRFKKHDASSVIRRYSRRAALRGDLVRAGQWAIGQRNEFQPYLLCLQDPANPYNDLGRKTHAIKHILATIVRVREIIWRRMKSIREYQFLGRDVPYEPILTTVVGRPDLVWKRYRQHLEEYGRKKVEEGVVELPDEEPSSLETLGAGIPKAGWEGIGGGEGEGGGGGEEGKGVVGAYRATTTREGRYRRAPRPDIVTRRLILRS